MTSSAERSVQVRPVIASDVPAVVALVRSVLAEFGIAFGVGSETDAQLLGLPGSYEARGGGFWVALSGDGALLGTCGLFPVGEGEHELRKMYLDPAARGLGVGQRLLDVSLSFARARGVRSITLDTTEQMAAAIRFYEKNGFVRDDGCIRASRCSRGYRLALSGSASADPTG